MGTYKRTEGQTLIETAIILFLLLLILLGITEFSRAWYTKNSLKNAARHGARVAVVITPASDLEKLIVTDAPCPTKDKKDPCSSTNAIIDAVCCKSPGVPRTKENNTWVSLSLDKTTQAPTNILNSGDTITVRATTKFKSVVGSSFWPWLQNIDITTDASMRYE